jgi:phage tail sheath protein FI
VTYPGVYIEEFAPGAPIEGVGTSTAAFIGVVSKGELDTPTKITSWDQFRAVFGEHPVPGFFLWYAVRGFFENGGLVCYVVRASNGTYAGLGLDDPANGLPNRANDPMLLVRARQPGVPAPAIEIQVAGKHLIQAANALYQPTSSYIAINSREIELPAPEDTAQFRAGDLVDLGSAGARVPVLRVSGARIRLASDLANMMSGNIRLADADTGTRTLRLRFPAPPPPGALVAGTVLTITQGATPPDTQVVESVQAEPLATMPAVTTYRVTFRQGLALTLSLDPANPATVQSEDLDIHVKQGVATTLHDNLGVDAAHPRYFLRMVNDEDALLRLLLIEPPPAAGLPASLPKDTAGFQTLQPGTAEDLTTMGDHDYIDALETLREIDDVNLIAVPDCLMIDPANGTAQAVKQAVIAHCEQMADRFAVLDAGPGLPLFGTGSVEEQRTGLDSERGYAALYYPWLRVRPFGPGAPILVPPSGHVCGVMARVDGTRGVHKAPANEIVNGALGVERTMSDVDQGQLNIKGINAIRIFQTGGRPMVWGGRTTATTTTWRYVNVRRLFLMLEESIQEGIRWAVFEPNTQGLWEKLSRTITEFLTRVWRDGALFGATPKEAFYVRIDETLNPDSVRALGRLYLEIGVRPAYPAEFIIVRIGIWQGGGEVSEG